MDIFEEEPSPPLPSFALGRVVLFLPLGFLLLFLFWLGDIRHQPWFPYGIAMCIIYVLLALRQKIVFHEDKLYVKRMARQPIYIPYKSIREVTYCRKKKSMISIVYDESKPLTMPLSFFSSERFEVLKLNFGRVGIELTKEEFK